jgi:mRNA-degrading endonuclease RelE of RelBE toxin-antitoxin system
VKRTLYFAPPATAALRQLDRRFVSQVWAVLHTLLEDPDSVAYQSEPDDPSVYGVAVGGDALLWFEILDERHAIRVLDIEE